MKITKRTPKADGFHMPAEFEPHHGCLMIWPYRQGSWPFGAKEARKAFAKVANTIAESEKVYMLIGKGQFEEARQMLLPEIELIEIPTDDAWARDTGPTFVMDSAKTIRGINWKFNAWGGEVDGLYAHYERDNAVASAFCDYLNVDYYDAGEFVLEGGSIHTDGEGTILVTKACLLSKGRNPSLSQEEIEERLKQYLGAEKIIWLAHGIYQDETNEHIDNICAFTAPGQVVLAWTDDKADPQYHYSKECLETLRSCTDAKGRTIKVHKLPIPNKTICIKKEELKGYIYEEGEAQREEGERLAASYVNFYIANQSVLVPAFEDENDKKAVEILQKIFPNRKVISIPAREILLGGGNIHCITQQIPDCLK